MQEERTVQDLTENSEALSESQEVVLEWEKHRKWLLFSAYFGKNALSQEGGRILY